MPLILSAKAQQVKPGVYQHFKGRKFQVFGVGFHTETLEELVVYQERDGQKLFWIRPVDSFLEVIEDHSERMPRFTPSDP